MTWRVARDVAWVAEEDGSRVYAMAMPPTRPVILIGPLAAIWRAVAEGDEPTDAVANGQHLDPQVVRADIDAALGEMGELGLLERADDG